MNKGRVLLLLVILCTTFFVNKEGISARWVVRAGYGDYVERVCENGIVFNYFHDAYGGTIDWDHNPFGNEWVSRKVESCENGTCEELSVISATVGDGEADLTLGPNYVADFWVLRWSDDVPLGSTITVTLEWDEDSDFITGGVVEECSLPERAPSLFSFCSQTQHLGSKVTLNTPNIKIFDLEMTLATSSVYSSTFSTNLTSPNGTSIKLLDNFSRPPELYGYKCLQEANFNSADGSEVVIWSDSGIDPYDPFDPKPQVPLANFNGITTAGNWQLNFENLNGNPFTVNLDCWCLYMVGTPVNTTYLPLTTGGTQSTSANNPPNVPSNPSHNSSVTLEEFDNRTVSLQWNGGDPNGDNVTYDVYVEANDPTPDVLACGGFANAQCDLNYFFPTTDYYWQVVATDSHGAKTEGPIWKFSDPLCVGECEATIPEGYFWMGCDINNPSVTACHSSGDEEPLHEVWLDTFNTETTKVTNAQYARCVEDGPCEPPDNFGSVTRVSYYDNPTYANYPVIYVSWEDANNYCTWAGKRLPTEAEWEKAARGANDTRRYPWGNSPYDCSVANVFPSTGICTGDTTPVDAYPAGQSPYGVFEMVGNVWEWTNDWYQSDYYVNSPSVNPQGPESGTEKVRRGSAWGTGASNGRIARRIPEAPSLSSNYIGFRCVSDPID